MSKSDCSKAFFAAGVLLVSGTWGCSDDDGDGGKSDGGSIDAAADATSGTDGSTAVDASPDGLAMAAAQARGKYLVDHVIACGDCHTPKLPTGAPDLSKYLAGGFCFVPDAVDPMKCLLASRNLTSDATGLKNYTDDEIKDMFLNGKRPAATKETLVPIMPYYVFHNMKADDADAIVAYLRTVPPVNNADLKRGAMFDTNPPAAAPLTLAKIPAVPDAYPDKASAERGKYLATQVGLCVECHTTKLPPGSSVLNEDKLFEGGEDFSPFFPPQFNWKIVSKNITSDVATGIGDRTVQDIVNELLQGIKKNQTKICPPMPAGPMAAYGGLTVADATDIANYIHSLPPKTSATPPNMCAPPMPPDGGVQDASPGN